MTSRASGWPRIAVIERVGLDAPGVREVLDEALADPDSAVREAAKNALASGDDFR